MSELSRSMPFRARRLVLVLSCVCLAAVPSVASAQQTVAPPGKAGADQYFETVPTARGNVAPPSSGSAAHGAPTSSERALARLGRDGQAAAALAAAGSPLGTGARAGRAAEGRVGPSPAGAGVAASVAHSLTGGSGSGGLGVGLPLTLGVALLLVLAWLLVRRRRRDADAV